MPTASKPTQATPITTYQGHTGPVYTVAWSPDGTRIASASQDGTFQVWDAGNGHPLLTYQDQARPVWAVAWVPDGASNGGWMRPSPGEEKGFERRKPST